MILICTKTSRLISNYSSLRFDVFTLRSSICTRTRAWVKVTANSKPRPKNVINVQHVIKIYQALPLLRFSRHYYCVKGGVPGSRLLYTCGYYSRAATIRRAAIIRINMVCGIII